MIAIYRNVDMLILIGQGGSVLKKWIKNIKLYIIFVKVNYGSKY